MQRKKKWNLLDNATFFFVGSKNMMTARHQFLMRRQKYMLGRESRLTLRNANKKSDLIEKRNHFCLYRLIYSLDDIFLHSCYHLSLNTIKNAPVNGLNYDFAIIVLTFRVAIRIPSRMQNNNESIIC